MIVLSIDTCDSRGSVALLRDDAILGLIPHETKDEYSSWLLPAVNDVLKMAGLAMKDVGGYAVAAGPGSFTGVRVGLTTVKAWVEVYGKRVAAISRLEGIAAQAPSPDNYVAAFVDAQRGQVFGAIYREEDGCFAIVGEEMVIAPGAFVENVAELTDGKKVAWVSPDAALLETETVWKEREKRGERIERASPTLAGILGRIGMRRLQRGKATDALGLDANYVRRSDAEIFWKGRPVATELRPEPARSLRPEDAGAVAEILRQSPEAVFWPEASVREVLGWQGILGLANEVKGEVVGFLIARQVKEEAEVLNLAVARQNRGRGEGRALLRAAVGELCKRGVTRVFLEVRESNATGIAFYQKHGFSQAGRREGYYREPVEAAIVMEMKVTE